MGEGILRIPTSNVLTPSIAEADAAARRHLLVLELPLEVADLQLEGPVREVRAPVAEVPGGARVARLGSGMPNLTNLATFHFCNI